ncbi:hypothetical protein CPT_Moonbeam120 [Bacillus phage Moonbeam]|uniref:Uncharacterized protein n=1 Tax=Bacillus phage Moonbeam TaxID=1540091 RepID=A0A0A0RV64_9CAUD|nr:hypothetical protein CPT_Moonbeam120 [Bacillus phage Moonbeam]AIW03518.1 hypothetical protein CPT_Moonbeam120 [Bacillus phage Moonbeam]
MEINIGSFDFEWLRLKDESGATIDYNLREELKVNEQTLMQDMLEQPAKYVYWSSVLEKLKYYQEAEELKVERRLAEIDAEAREHYKGTETKATKDVVETYRKMHEDYEATMGRLQYYKMVVGYVTRIVKAFEQRKDMLQSYGKQIADQKMHGAGTNRFMDGGY